MLKSASAKAGFWCVLLVCVGLRAVENPPVVVGAIGDYGIDNYSAAEVASMVKSWNPDVIVTLGDNNYGAAGHFDLYVGRPFHDFIHPYVGVYGPGAVSNRFFPTIGNHDTANLQAYFNFFTLPGNERYYSFQHGPIDFFALNSELPEPDGLAADSAQAQWLRTRLGASVAPWRLVYFHTPPYSSSIHGVANEGAPMRWPFAQWGATAILGGHDHIYERLFINGMYHFVNGLGGIGSYPIYPGTHSGSQVQYNATPGAMRIEATSTNLVFEFININSEVIDSVVIGPAPAPRFRILYSSGDRQVCPGTSVIFRVTAATASGSGALRHQWYFEGQPIHGQTNSTFVVGSADVQNEGAYHVTVWDGTASLTSQPARLALLRSAIIDAHPEGRMVVATSNLVLRVYARSCSGLGYQWQHNGTNIPNAGSAFLLITNVQAHHAGEYRAFVFDVTGPLLSEPALVTVVFPARFAQQPVSQSTVEGQDVTFSVATTGTPPITYEWRLGSTVRLTNMVLNENLCFFMLRSVQLTQAGPYRVGLSNSAGQGPAGMAATLTVLADNDRDGIADLWENAYGFQTNSVADAVLDADNDGMSNRAEFIAGTNPTNALSYLRIEAKIDSGALLYFGAVSNRTYTIEHADSLPPVGWLKVADVVARATNRVEVIRDLGWTSNRFYRLATPRQP